ncbi:MAG: hypothetical protein UX46_C0012G0009 [Candidatus Amesbacteria bacterium GW2011_GWC1_46_24]|nr:MAG: hypothetical protein UX46_C0012G0009 [Candidatus Amesbacteria bacterium GW2011_GWC1_46_24]
MDVEGAKTGQALVQLNETGDQDILTASASGTGVFTLSRTGDISLFSGTATSDTFRLTPSASSGTAYTGTLTTAQLTDNRTWYLPDNGGTIALTSDLSASTNFWQSNDGALTPYSTTLDLNLGATATSSAKISLAGSLTRGKALGIFNQTEQQDILAASAAGANVWRLGYDGSIVQTTSASTGLGYSLVGNSLSTGSLLSISSTSTALSSGNLALLDWSPSNWATASGDLFKINIGQYGDITGNLFAVYDNTSELFSIDTVKITSALPHEFTYPGDVTMAYDLNFTNQTSGNIKSKGPLTIDTGENNESNDLTLRTYNSGQVIIDTVATGGLGISSNTSGYNLEGLLSVEGAKTGKALVILNEAGDQNILAASASGTGVFTLSRTGLLSVPAAQGLDVLSAGALNLGTATATSLGLGSAFHRRHYRHHHSGSPG